MIVGGASTREEPLIREENHPAGTSVDTRIVGRGPAGYAKGKLVLNGEAGRKHELEGVGAAATTG